MIYSFLVSYSSYSLGTSNFYPKICSLVEDNKITPVVGDVGFSSITDSVEEVGEVLDWISDLDISGSLCQTLNGIWV